MRIVIGLRRDYENRVDDIDVKHHNGLYFPADQFYNCDPLPESWLELFMTSHERMELLAAAHDDLEKFGDN
jgi:hypothetical protein